MKHASEPGNEDHALTDQGSDDLLAEALDLARLGTFAWDLSSGEVALDGRARTIWGFGPDEVVTASVIFDRVTPEDRGQFEAEMGATRGHIGRFDTECRVRRPDGSTRWVASLSRIQPGPDGAAARAAGVFQDVTASRASEARFRALVRASSEVLYSMSPDWGEMRALAGGGFLADTTTASPRWLEDYIHPDDHAAVRAAIDEAIRTKSVFHLEHRVRRADGRLGWTLSRAVPLLDAAGEVTEWFGAASDVTEQRDAELALRANAEHQAFRLALEERLRDLADPLEVIAAAAEALGRHLGVNQVTYAEAEPRDEFVTIAREWNDGTTASNAGRHRLDDFGPAFIAELRRGETTTISNVRLDPRTSSPEALATFAQAGIAALLNVPLIKAGRMVLILGVHSASPRGWSAEEVALAQEIAERTWAAVEQARAEADLRALARRNSEILESISDAFYAVDRDWRFTYVNRKAEEWWGRRREDLLGKGYWEEFPHAVGSEPYKAHLRAMEAREVVRLEAVSPILGHWVDISIYPAAEGGLSVYFRDITDKKQAEERLRESEERLARVLDEVPVGVGLFDVQGRFTLKNPRLRAMIGDAIPSRDAVKGLSWHGFDTIGRPIAPQDYPGARVLRGEDGGPPVDFRQVEDGSDRWLRVSAVPLQDDKGAMSGGITVVQDVTDEIRVQQALRESEARYRQIVQGAEDFAIVVLDEAGLITSWNSGAERLMGFSEEEVLGQPGAIFFTPEDRVQGAPDREMNKAQADGRAVNERWHQRKDGSRFWGSGLMMPIAGPGSGFIKMFRDRTAEHEAETRREALVQLTDRLRDLDDPDEIAFAASKILGQTLGVSRVGYAMVDDEAETLHVERDWTAPGVETIAGTHRLRDYGSFIDSLKRGEQIAISDVRLDDRTASAADALEGRSARSFTNVPVMERGRLVAELFINHAEVRDWSPEDLTLIQEVAGWTRTAVERARSAAALRELNETLEAKVEERTAERNQLWNLSQDMLARADYQGMMSAVSPAWTRVLGWSEAELLSRPYASFMHSDDMSPTLEALARMGETGEPTRFENRIATKDGGWKPIEWTVASEPDSTNFIAVGRDITAERERQAELEQAQEALRQSQKMDAMGQLTGGVAHDFNNLLTPILGSLDRLQRKAVGDQRDQRLIEGALQSAERARTLVQRLLAFARRQPLQPTAVNVRELVQGMAELVESTTGPQIEVAVDMAPDLPSALADANQLEMAILNLAVNSRDAMPSGGMLRISARSEAVGTRHPSGATPGRYIRLSVADTGTGMDEDTLARAVEPFFSTKGVGRGTGLGLSMVHGLTAQLGGALTIRSRPGLGTNVELWLPAADPAVADKSAGRDLPGERAPLPTGTALLVDDEEFVRATTADMLADLGYAVVEAASAEEALRRIDAGLAPDLLVTDHLMPGMSGTELVRTLGAQHPGLPALIVSGYAEVEGIAPDLPRLAKPFRCADLSASIVKLMDGTKSRT